MIRLKQLPNATEIILTQEVTREDAKKAGNYYNLNNGLLAVVLKKSDIPWNDITEIHTDQRHFKVKNNLLFEIKDYFQFKISYCKPQTFFTILHGTELFRPKKPHLSSFEPFTMTAIATLFRYGNPEYNKKAEIIEKEKLIKESEELDKEALNWANLITKNSS